MTPAPLHGLDGRRRRAGHRGRAGCHRVLRLLLLALVAGAVLALAGGNTGLAQEQPTTSSTEPTDDEPTGDEPTGDEPTGDEPTGDEPDDGETADLPVVRGTLIDKKGTRERDDDEAVEGAIVTVTDPAGEQVAEDETDDEGRFELELPGPGTYTATLDLDSLGDDVGLPPEGRESVQIDPNRSRVLAFDLGARTRETRSRLDEALQLSVEGIKFGLVIAMASVGLSLIFGTTGLTNFAHGELVTFGAIVAWFINVDAGLTLIPATIAAMVVGGLGAGLLDVGLWRPLRRRGVSLLAMMITSIGLSLLLRNVFQYWFGEGSRSYGQYFAQRAIDIGPISIAPKNLVAMGVSIAVLVLVGLLLLRTRLGKAMRAVADNPDLASSSGIDVDRVILLVWLFGGALATLGGVLQAIDEQVRFDRGFSLLLLMFAGVTLGGLGTAFGALIGSIVIGFVVQVSTLWVPSNLKNVGALVILILILMLRPQGILGRAERVG